MGRVGGERSFPGQQVVEADCGQVERGTHRVDLGNALWAGTHTEVSAAELTRDQAKVFERPGEPPGLVPRHHPGGTDHQQGEPRHRRPDQRNLLDHSAVRGRGTDGTDDVRVVGDGDAHDEVAAVCDETVSALQRVFDCWPTCLWALAGEVAAIVVVDRHFDVAGPCRVVDRLVAADGRGDRDGDGVSVALEVDPLFGHGVLPYTDRERHPEQRH